MVVGATVPGVQLQRLSPARCSPVLLVFLALRMCISFGNTPSLAVAVVKTSLRMLPTVSKSGSTGAKLSLAAGRPAGAK